MGVVVEGMSRRVVEAGNRRLLERVLREMLDSEVPSLLEVLNFYSRSVLGKDFVECLVENPGEVYRVLIGAFYLREVMDVIDRAITSYLEKNYGVRIEEGLLKRLSEGRDGFVTSILRAYKDRGGSGEESGSA